MKISKDGRLKNSQGEDCSCGNYCQLCGLKCAMFEILFESNNMPEIPSQVLLRCCGRKIDI